MQKYAIYYDYIYVTIAYILYKLKMFDKNPNLTKYMCTNNNVSRKNTYDSVVFSCLTF